MGTSALIGVWYQPAASFGKWKARGINTLIGYESEGGTVSMDTWKAAARSAGLLYACQPSADLAADAADASLVAWLNLPDEPDGAGGKTPAVMTAQYAAMHAAGPGKPVLLQLDGWQMKWKPASDYKAYAAAGDWLCADVYVYNGGRLQSIADYGARIDLLGASGPGKRRLACIECSDQQLGAAEWAQTSYCDAAGNLSPKPGPGLVSVASRMSAPTPEGMRAQIATVLAHGCTGVIYFPDVIGRGWLAFDGTTPELQAAMLDANRQILNAPPLAGKTITIDGHSYILTPRN